MKLIQIKNSYSIWNTDEMKELVREACFKEYRRRDAVKLLNRTYKSMYIEWYWHNIGYYLTLPFIKNDKIRVLNERFKHVDLEEHK